MSRVLRIAALLIVLSGGAWGVLFCLANPAGVGLDLVFWRLPEAPLAVWVLGSFIVGGLCGLLAASAALWRAHMANAALRRRETARAPATERTAPREGDTHA